MEKEDEIIIESAPAEKNRIWKILIIILIILLLAGIVIVISLKVQNYIIANKNVTNSTKTNVTDLPSTNGSYTNITNNPKTSVCGDGRCNGTENKSNCPKDCKRLQGGGGDPNPPCTPNCAGKNCGDDGCGESCGPCTNGICNSTGICVPFVNCSSDINCTSFTGVCGIGKCNTTVKQCYSSFNSSTTICRRNVSECDAIEMCTNNSISCGIDLNKSDGSFCSLGNCSSGRCINSTGCSNDFGCINSGIYCSGNTPYNCSNKDADTCLERSNLTVCSSGFSCVNGYGCTVLLSALSIKRDNITWNFAEPYTYGEYVNGDYWVLDDGNGVNITSIIPDDGVPPLPQIIVNPNASRLNGMNYNLGNLKGGSSLLVVQNISGFTHDCYSCQSCAPDCNCPGFVDVSSTCSRAYSHCLNYRAAVLTIVSIIPPLDAFRPPLAGNEKPVYTASQLKTNLLPSISITNKPGISYLNGVAKNFSNIWLDYQSGWSSRFLHPVKNMPAYGREISQGTIAAANLLLLDYTYEEKKELLVYYIQYGIDVYYAQKSGTYFGPDGGHMHGRKWPVIFAGIMLDDEELKNPTGLFAEDGHTYYGINESLFGQECTSCYMDNGCSYSGTCQSGAKDCKDVLRLRDACDYRFQNSPQYPGETLPAIIMKDSNGKTGKDLWAHDPFFDYTDRWVKNGGGIDHVYIEELWRAYREDYGCIWYDLNWQYNCSGTIVECNSITSCVQYPNQRACDYDPCNLGCNNNCGISGSVSGIATEKPVKTGFLSWIKGLLS